MPLQIVTVQAGSVAIRLNTAKRLRPKERLNWAVDSDIVRRLLVWKHHGQAKLTGRGYYCAHGRAV
ncbi:MAG: hypothetical protein IH623_12345 [Verrucomicrobia bacterium]|nr:hypothetical protein [Verrucomicrobiota bacterium]